MNLWPQAVLFDFDGVLVNSEPLHFFAFQEVLKAEGIDLTEQQYYRQLLGFDDRGGFQHVLAIHGRQPDPDTVRRLMSRKEHAMQQLIHDRKYQALPGVDQFVRALSRNYPLAICSGALRREIEMMLEGVNLRDCFPVIVSAEDVQVGKPDPRGYLLTLQQLSEYTGRTLSPDQCLVVEDAPSVIRSVRNVGFSVLAVATSHPLTELSEANWAVNALQCDEVRKLLPQLRLSA